MRALIAAWASLLGAAPAQAVFVIALAFVCASCAPAQVRSVAARPGTSPERTVVCTIGAQCDQLWSDASFWIGQHSPRGVQVETREELSTGCGGEAADPCLDLVRVPLDPEREEIRIKVECSGSSACVPDAVETKRELIDYLIGFPPVDD